MSDSIYWLVKDLSEREGIEQKEVLETLALTFQKLYQQKLGEDIKLKLDFDEDKKKIIFYRSYQTANGEKNTEKDISRGGGFMDSTKSKRESNQLLIPIDLNLEEMASSESVLHEFRSLLEKKKREKSVNNFRLLEGSIVEGDIQTIKERLCLVKLNEEAIGVWAREDWLPRERPERGQHLRFLIKRVEEDKIFLTRKDDSFLLKLLETEVPEIKEGIIVIKEILRLPGIICKAVVESKKLYLNPSGTCIGREGSRIKNVVKDMAKERIDIVDWNENQTKLIINLFSPVKVISFLAEKSNQGEDFLRIIIPESQMSLILVNGGKLVELISNFFGKKIKVESLEENRKNDRIIHWNTKYTMEEYLKLKNKNNVQR